MWGVISRVGKWHPTDEANSVLSIASYLGLGSAEAKWPPRNPPGEVTADPPTIHKTPVLDRFAQNLHCLCVLFTFQKQSAGSTGQPVKLNHLSVIGFESVLECVSKFQSCQMFWNVLLIW